MPNIVLFKGDESPPLNQISLVVHRALIILVDKCVVSHRIALLILLHELAMEDSQKDLTSHPDYT